MHKIKPFQIVMCIGIVSVCCQIVRGELITPISVISSTAETDLWSAMNLINDNGLNPPYNEYSMHCEHNSSNSWVTDQPGDVNESYYYDFVDVGPSLTFELDGPNNLDQIVIWNYAADEETAKNCAKLIKVGFSQSGIEGEFSDEVQIFVEKGIANQYTLEAPQIISLEGFHLANAVRLTIMDNHYDGIDAGGGGDRVGLSEVKFLAPEPGSLVLLLSLGIGIWLVRGQRLCLGQLFADGKKFGRA